MEGLVVKGASTSYQPARRDWVKVNSVAVPSVWARACGAFGLVRHKVIGGLPVNDICRARAAMLADGAQEDDTDD